MIKSALFRLLYIFISIAILLFLLLHFAKLPNREKNGFTRTWLSNSVSTLLTGVSDAPLQRICGATAHNLFFTVPNPTGVIVIDKSLQRQDTMVFGLPFSERHLGLNYTMVDSPNIYFISNNTGLLFKGVLNSWQLDSIQLSDYAITRCALLSPQEAVIRYLNDSVQKQRFKKINIHTGAVTAEAEILPQQEPGGFDTDGMLLYDNASNRLLFVQYYNNLFFCIDTNLRTVYTSHTIDTIQTNQVSVKEIKNGEETRLTPSTSRITVNKNSCVGNGYLFVLSGLKADNETTTDFNNNEVIDLYKITDGSYAGSFYIPAINGEKISSMWVDKDRLVVLYKTGIKIISSPS